MAIPHEEVSRLNGSPATFGLLADFMRGALCQVVFVRDEETETRRHMITSTEEFPTISIAVEGSPARPVKREFFALPAIYKGAWWELLDDADETAIRELIARKDERDQALIRDAQRFLENRRRDVIARKAEAELARTAEGRGAALRSLLEAIAAPDEARRWPVILQDLDSVLDIIDRDADRNFIADVAGWQRWIGSARTLTPNRLSWLADVLTRTGPKLRTSPPAAL